MNTKSSDTLVKQMMTKIYQQSWRHHKNDVIRDVMVQPVYDQPISKSIEEPLVPNSTLQEDQQHHHNHHQHHHQHLNPNLINNNEESELHNFSTISSSLLLPSDSVNDSVEESVNHSQPHTPHDKVCDHTSAKSYHGKTPLLPKPLRNKRKVNDFKPLDLAMDLPDVPPPVPSVPPPTNFTGNGHVVMNIPDTCPTCGAPTDVEKRKQYNFDYGPVRKYARKSPPPPPLPPAQDRSKKIQRLASFNKDRLTGDLRPLTLNRCTSVPSVYECVGIDEPKRYSSPRCPRCVAGAVGRPCRYHKRDHGHHRAQRDTGEKRGLPSQIMDLDDNYIPDCPCCEKAARSSDQKKYHANNSNNNSKNYHHYNMDKHLSFYSGMPHLWNYDLQDYEERRKNYENREKRLIFIVVLFAIILFFTLLYFGIMAFQKFTQIPKSFSTIKSS